MALARALACAPRLLLLSEPTRGVDIGARPDIYHSLRQLARQGVPVVVSTSDLVEIRELADEVMTMYRGRVVGRHPVRKTNDAKLLREFFAGRHEHTFEAYGETYGPTPRTIVRRDPRHHRDDRCCGFCGSDSQRVCYSIELWGLSLSLSLIGIVAIGLSFITICGQVFSLSLSTLVALSTICFANLLQLGALQAMLITIIMASCAGAI